MRVVGVFGKWQTVGERSEPEETDRRNYEQCNNDDFLMIKAVDDKGQSQNCKNKASQIMIKKHRPGNADERQQVKQKCADNQKWKRSNQVYFFELQDQLVNP